MSFGFVAKPSCFCVQEMLLLPTELLFCDRALPMDDAELWRRAASALLAACGDVFSCAVRQLQPKLLGEWLRASRRSLEWLPEGEQLQDGSPSGASAILGSLARHRSEVLALAWRFPEELLEVAEQLARWPLCDVEAAPLLEGLVKELAKAPLRPGALLPLLGDLASDRWPRAALSPHSSLDWHFLAQLALHALGASLGGPDAEAAVAIWQNFALTVLEGTRSWSDEAEHGGPHACWYPLVACMCVFA